MATAAPPGPAVEVPRRFGYVAAFLTLRCNLHCPWCINRAGGRPPPRTEMSGRDWVRALNRLRCAPDLPVTLQGGEPSLHPDFLGILAGLRPDLPVDLLTNLQFDLDAFLAAVPPGRLRRDAPYSSIRVSYHPGVMDLDDTRARVRRLLDRGYSVGLWAVRHPAHLEEVERARAVCAADGIDFRFKEFLGLHEGRLHGLYKYPGAVSGRVGGPVECRTCELIVGPDGAVHRCHADLYAGRVPVGHLLDPAFAIEDVFRPCDLFGRCNPCDVKVKTDRHQQSGHTSVEIRPVQNHVFTPRIVCSIIRPSM